MRTGSSISISQGSCFLVRKYNQSRQERQAWSIRIAIFFLPCRGKTGFRQARVYQKARPLARNGLGNEDITAIVKFRGETEQLGKTIVYSYSIDK